MGQKTCPIRVWEPIRVEPIRVWATRTRMGYSWAAHDLKKKLVVKALDPATRLILARKNWNKRKKLILFYNLLSMKYKAYKF